MTSIQSKRPVGIWIISVIAIVFGLLTVKSGGLVLFVDGEFRQQAGHYVPFVVWFNFLAGFFYLIAGYGLWRQQHWGVWLSATLTMASILVFVIFGFYINEGGSYETRTVIAMSARCTVWSVIALFSYKLIVSSGRA